MPMCSITSLSIPLKNTIIFRDNYVAHFSSPTLVDVVIEGNDLSGWTNHYPLYQKKFPKKNFFSKKKKNIYIYIYLYILVNPQELASPSPTSVKKIQKFRIKKIWGSKKFWSKKFGSEKILGPKKISGPMSFWIRKIFSFALGSFCTIPHYPSSYNTVDTPL